jgi:hypothetical protein
MSFRTVNWINFAKAILPCLFTAGGVELLDANARNGQIQPMDHLTTPLVAFWTTTLLW